MSIVSLASVPLTLGQYSPPPPAAATPGGPPLFFYMVGIVAGLAIVGLICGFMFYGVLEKGHQPGWASFIPIYNAALLFKMSGKSPYLALLFLCGFIPLIGFIVNIGMSIFLGITVGKAFGKGGGFITGLVLLPIVFFPILGYGRSQYLLDHGVAPQGFPVLPPTQAG